MYAPTTEQLKVFNDLEPMVTQTLEGFNVCAMVYGSTGSGKAATFDGTEGEPGLLLRSITCIFDAIARAPEAMQFQVYLSMVEVVGEQLRDLQLSAEESVPRNMKLAADATYGVQVEGLTNTQVHTASHARSLLNAASATRAQGGQPAGSTSMLVQLTLHAFNSDNSESAVGKLLLVELADSGGTNTPAEVDTDAAAPADEQIASQGPLAALHSVMNALASNKKADFGGSILTKLLQDALSGNSKTMLLINVAPTQSHAIDAKASLVFGNKVRSISIGPASKVKENMQTAMNKVNTTMSALTQHANKGGSKKK